MHRLVAIVVVYMTYNFLNFLTASDSTKSKIVIFCIQHNCTLSERSRAHQFPSLFLPQNIVWRIKIFWRAGVPEWKWRERQIEWKLPSAHLWVANLYRRELLCFQRYMRQNCMLKRPLRCLLCTYYKVHGSQDRLCRQRVQKSSAAYSHFQHEPFWELVNETSQSLVVGVQRFWRGCNVKVEKVE